MEEVTQRSELPSIIRMREVPAPKSAKVLFWVDDEPNNNLKIANKVVRKYEDLSFVPLTSTKEAIETISRYKWLIHLNEQ